MSDPDPRTLPTWVVNWDKSNSDIDPGFGETVNYGLAGGNISSKKHYRRRCDQIMREELFMELEILFMLQEAEWHANWGVE